MKAKPNDLYEHDFYSWTQNQAGLIRAGRLADADLVNLVEEIESLGTSQEHALGSSFRVLLTHLLKVRDQSQRITESWRLSIANHRDDIDDLLRKNPGLKSKQEELYRSAYRRARRDAAIETGLPLTVFPVDNPFDLSQACDPDLWPADPETDRPALPRRPPSGRRRSRQP